jgi:hypothetical protein
MERPKALVDAWVGRAEQFQRLVLGGGGEGEEGDRTYALTGG